MYLQRIKHSFYWKKKNFWQTSYSRYVLAKLSKLFQISMLTSSDSVFLQGVQVEVSNYFSEFFQWGKRMNSDTSIFIIFRKTLGKYESYSAEGLKSNFISPVVIWKQRLSKHFDFNLPCNLEIFEIQWKQLRRRKTKKGNEAYKGVTVSC